MPNVKNREREKIFLTTYFESSSVFSVMGFWTVYLTQDVKKSISGLLLPFLRSVLASLLFLSLYTNQIILLD